MVSFKVPNKLVVFACLLIMAVWAKSSSELYQEIEEALLEMAAADTGRPDPGHMDMRMDAEEGTRNGDPVKPETRQLVNDNTYEAVTQAIADAKNLRQHDENLKQAYFEAGIDVPPGGSSPAAMAALNGMDTNESEFERQERIAVVALFATRILLDRGVFTNFDELREDPSVAKAFSEENQDACLDQKASAEDCSADANSEFRRIDGTCNNLNNPLWGSAGTAQVRLLPAAYQDGYNATRNIGASRAELRSARYLSATLLRNASNTESPADPERSMMVTVWGQFLDHDITETPQSKSVHKSSPGCCSLPEAKRRERIQCATIPIDPTTDHHFKDPDHVCMDLVRSSPALSDPCVPGVREQVNAVTAFIDASQVYGSEESVSKRLRSGFGGLMRVEKSDMLPKNDNSTCLLTKPSTHCLLAGDVRVNENPHLGAIHTAFVRYHNYLARRLRSGGMTSDDVIYNTVRKIIGGIIQHITYSVWLPDVIGTQYMNKYKLTLQYQQNGKVKSKYFYKRKVNPSIQNCFSTAALRYGHTLVGNSMIFLSGDYFTKEVRPLSSNFFQPEMIFENIKGLVRWMVSLQCQKSDGLFDPSIHDELFMDSFARALDLGALNIQRGRDHGLPSYLEYRKLCFPKEPAITSFNDLKDHSPYYRQTLKDVYGNVEDIELFTGGMTEDTERLRGAHLGPTFSCLLGEQFKALKQGDRYWFEQPQPFGFSDAQRDNIKNVPLAKIFCEVFRLPYIQDNIFKVPKLNEWRQCSDLPDIDVDLWLK